MLFVDGENLTLRGQELAKMNGVKLLEGTHYQQDVFLWLKTRRHATESIPRVTRWLGLQDSATRAFYYTSVRGDDDKVMKIREALWEIGFAPEVFKKASRSAKAKGVDIALTKDLLSNAFLNNYDVAVVLTGDADYRPVIDEVKRLGKTVCVLAITGGTAKVNPALRLSADYFDSLDDLLIKSWPKEEEPIPLDETPDHSDRSDG